MKSGFYPDIGKYYDTDAADFDDRYWQNPVLQQMRQSFREEVKRHPFLTVLEIGCGTGIDLLHFGITHPQVQLSGIDVSKEMIRLSINKINQNKLTNVHAYTASVEECPELFQDQKFDLIYVFFGALNTVENLAQNAKFLKGLLKPGGRMVLSFVNRWYVGGILLESVRFRFARATSRLHPVWKGYSPSKDLHSRCYTPGEIRRAFSEFRIVRHHGYCILHPAWYYTRMNQKLGRLRRIFWLMDEWLNHTALWRFGEYTLFTFQHAEDPC
ncbi:MAG: methyltransferase domain-containing protein [Bacteroidales bacterium]|jgi:SAM-dependent methyltransferase